MCDGCFMYSGAINTKQVENAEAVSTDLQLLCLTGSGQQDPQFIFILDVL